MPASHAKKSKPTNAAKRKTAAVRPKTSRALHERERILKTLPEAREKLGPCIAALERVETALDPVARARLAEELGILGKAVADCPRACGCHGADRFTVIFSDAGKFLGELLTKAGSFANLYLSSAGEDLLGEKVRAWQLMGIPASGKDETTTKLRDAGFANAFSDWCEANGCKAVVLLEPQIHLWNRTQLLPLPEGDRLTVIERLAALPLRTALDVLDSWLPTSGNKDI